MLRIARDIFGKSLKRPAARNRATTRLGLERLDDRLLPSNTGAVSEVWAPHVGNVVYSVGQDQNLYESMNGGQSYRIDNGYCDLEVSAGTDQNGHPVAYVLNTYGSLWALTTSFDNNGMPFVSHYTHIADNIIHDPYNHWTSFSAAMGKDYFSGISGGVFYISNRYDRYFNFVSDYQISSAPVDYEISAGTDQYGNNVVYMLNGVDHNVYERHASGWWSEVDCQGGCMEIAGSVNNILYTLQDPYAPENGAPYAHYDGVIWENVRFGIARKWSGQQFTEVTFWDHSQDQLNQAGDQLVAHISAGTDIWGNSTLDYMSIYAGNPLINAYQYDAGSGGTHLLANNVRDVCAGSGVDFYVGTAQTGPLFEVYSGSSWVIGNGVRHDAYWW